MSRGNWGETAVGPRHGGKPLGALQVGDLSLEQDDPVLRSTVAIWPRSRPAKVLAR